MFVNNISKIFFKKSLVYHLVHPRTSKKVINTIKNLLLLQKKSKPIYMYYNFLLFNRFCP